MGAELEDPSFVTSKAGASYRERGICLIQRQQRGGQSCAGIRALSAARFLVETGYVSLAVSSFPPGPPSMLPFY